MIFLSSNLVIKNSSLKINKSELIRPLQTTMSLKLVIYQTMILIFPILYFLCIKPPTLSPSKPPVYLPMIYRPVCNSFSICQKIQRESSLSTMIYDKIYLLSIKEKFKSRQIKVGDPAICTNLYWHVLLNIIE